MSVSVIAVDRIIPGIKPDYCIHGESFCVGCDKAVWLGSETYKEVVAGLVPICLECLGAQVDLPAPSSHVDDHLRADGPHE